MRPSGARGSAGGDRRLAAPPQAKPPFVVGSNCAIFGTPCGRGHPSYRSVAPLHTVAALRFPAPSGPPIAPLPRNRLAFSAAGGASPLSSSPQNPLRWAFVGAPIGCAEKRKRLLMVSREKTLAAAFQTPFETPFPACYGGFGLVMAGGLDHSTTYGSFNSWGRSRMLPASLLLPHLGSCGRLVEGVVPDALLLLFCCRTSAVAGDRLKGWFRMPPAPLLLAQSGG